jgi:hypothetical protein
LGSFRTHARHRFKDYWLPRCEEIPSAETVRAGFTRLVIEHAGGRRDGKDRRAPAAADLDRLGRACTTLLEKELGPSTGVGSKLVPILVALVLGTNPDLENADQMDQALTPVMNFIAAARDGRSFNI